MMVAMNAQAAGLYDLAVKSIDGESVKLDKYSGKVLLIANTASECGYTPQYTNLQAVHEKYKEKGFAVLGFPSNDFGGQEPGSDKEIKLFCTKNYKVSFPMFSKGPVKGDKAQPLFAWLVEQSDSKKSVGWNFEKFLVSRSGQVLARFPSGVKPDSAEVTAAIEKALAAK